MFAGFGVSGSLLAAVGAAFVVAGGVLAFEQWPHAELRSAPDSLNVAAGSPPAASRSATQARPVALPPVAQVASPTSLGERRAARRPDRTPSGRTQVVPVGTIPPVRTTQATPVTAGSSSPVDDPGPSQPNVVETVTRSVGNSVRSVGSGLPAASSATDAVAGTVERAGQAIGSLLRRP